MVKTPSYTATITPVEGGQVRINVHYHDGTTRHTGVGLFVRTDMPTPRGAYITAQCNALARALAEALDSVLF